MLKKTVYINEEKNEYRIIEKNIKDDYLYTLFKYMCTSTENDKGDARTAYVCFTSGTTGRPKGVKTTRENIVAYARAKVKNERLDEISIVALVSAHVFDPCIGDLVSAMLAKSTLATFSPRDALMRGNTLKHALAARQATHV